MIVLRWEMVRFLYHVTETFLNRLQIIDLTMLIFSVAYDLMQCTNFTTLQSPVMLTIFDRNRDKIHLKSSTFYLLHRTICFDQIRSFSGSQFLFSKCIKEWSAFILSSYFILMSVRNKTKEWLPLKMLQCLCESRWYCVVSSSVTPLWV
jgi:hypothetical protein